MRDLTQSDLQVINFVRKDQSNTIIQDPKLIPLSFMISQYHIMFVYKNNLTVVSSISKEAIYSVDLETQTKNSCYDIQSKFVVLLGQSG